MFAVIQNDEVVEYFEDETQAYNEYLSCIEFGETESLYVVKLIEKYEETNEEWWLVNKECNQLLVASLSWSSMDRKVSRTGKAWGLFTKAKASTKTKV